MRKLCGFLSLSFSLLLGVSALSQVSRAQVILQDRITQPVDSAVMSPLTGSLRPMAKGELDQGLADNSKTVQGLSINFKRSASQEASLQALLQAQQDPTSPSYRKWLTPAQFGELYGMTSADLDKVTGWLQEEGFTVTSVSASRNSIVFSGNIAAISPETCARQVSRPHIAAIARSSSAVTSFPAPSHGAAAASLRAASAACSVSAPTSR